MLIIIDCGEFDNAGAMMSVDETLMCSFQILKPAEKKIIANNGSNHKPNTQQQTPNRPITPAKQQGEK